MGTRKQPIEKGRRVVLLVFPGAQVLDVAGPLEVFSVAARMVERRSPRLGNPYSLEIVAHAAGKISCSSGLCLVADRPFVEIRGTIDTLVVAGGTGVEGALADRALLRWLRGAAARSRRVASVCTGAFLLAEAGLLDGRRATTHWAWCDALARRYPEVRVERDPIFVRDGDTYTSAGVTAGMDLALALVEDDLGKEVALEAARHLVLFLRRPGGQAQFSAQLAVQQADRQPVRELQGWIADHPDTDLSVSSLARRVAMSPRSFARVFRREVGTTPGRFVEGVRVEAARRRLEESLHGVDLVASQCGFGSAESMRRAFLRTVRVAPSAYRSRFRALPSSGRRRSGDRA